MQVASLTGHRPSALDGSYDASTPLWRWIADETAKAYKILEIEKVITGMALGFDMLGADVAVQMGIPFIAAVPFKGQELRWPKASQERYHALLDLADRVEIVSEGGYAAWKMHKRSQWMVNSSDIQIALWNGKTSGGTYNAVQYAKQQQKTIYRINPLTLKAGLLSEAIYQ